MLDPLSGEALEELVEAGHGEGDAARPRLAPVRAMFVRGDQARRGLGTRIHELCEAATRAEGFTRLTLMATLPGVPLYES